MNLQVHRENLMQDVDDGKPKSDVDDQKQVKDGLDNENDAKDKSDDDSSPKEVNAAGQHVNTASPDITTGSFKLNVVGPSVNTASSYDQDSLNDMFTMGASHTLEVTHVEFFSDEDEPEVYLGNITNSYTVPTTPNTRIHKDHPIENVIGDVKSFVQTRRMTKPTSEQGFLSAIYEQKTHDTLNTCLYACFLSQIEPKSIAKGLSNSSWVKPMQEELLNKKDKRGIVIRNKVRLVAQCNRQEEGIDYEEVFAPVVGDEAIHKELGDKMERAATTASSLEEEQDSGDVGAQTRFGMHLILITIYTSCIQQFWAMAKANTVNGEHQIQALIDKKKISITESSIRSNLHLGDAGAKEIADLMKKVQKLERKKKSRTTGLKRLRKVGMSRRVESSEDKDIDDTQGRSDDADMFDINELHGDEVLWICRLVRKKSRVQRKRENLQAQLEAELIEEERLAKKQKEEANIALIESWDNTQAMMEADFELA
ncbi:hypothetical protein Tco_0792947 [Tanacetum coccineum]